MADRRPTLARKILLLLALVSFGMAAKIAAFDLSGSDGLTDCCLWIGLGALWMTAGLRASRLEPIPELRRPRRRRLEDPLPLGEWIAISVLKVLAGLTVLFVLAVISLSLLGPGPWLALLLPALLFALHGRPGRPRNPPPLATLLLGWLVLAPFLVLASLLCVSIVIIATFGPVME